MCVWCDGAAPGLDGYSLERRPDAVLAGTRWSGGHAEVVAGGLAAVLVRLRERVVEEAAFAPGPMVVVTLAGQGDGVDCFVGARLADGALLPDGLASLAVGAADYVLVNHHRSDGDAVERYAALLAWMRAQRVPRDAARFRHREEYPLHADFARPETVRLMVPVVADH